MWFDDVEGKLGGLLFGVVDRLRYMGDFVCLFGLNDYFFVVGNMVGNVFGIVINIINGIKGGKELLVLCIYDFLFDVLISLSNIYLFFFSGMVD